MVSFNQSLDTSLQLLYDYSSNFQISVELVQKLAQHLKLETFIDTSFQFGNVEGNNQQRLTIAASSILLDIDFENDRKVSNISLSIGNESTHTTENSKEYIESVQNNHGITVIKLNPNKNPLTFLKKSSDEKSIAEKILLANLSQPKLNKFPENLQYLAIIDKYANSNQDLFTYIERTALLLHTISQLEIERNPNNWQIEQGLNNAIGNVKIHDITQGKIGLFLEFWKDFRYINHESNTAIGNTYNVQFNIVSSSYNHEYLLENNKKEWEIANQGNKERVKFEFEDAVIPTVNNDGTNTTMLPWMFDLVLNHPIYVPKYILEYLGLDYTVEENTTDPLFKIFDKINNSQEVVDSINILGRNVSCLINHDLISNFIPLKSVKINHLYDLSSLIPILRNFIVLSNLYRTLSQNNCIIPRRKSRRRSSRVSFKNDKELTEEIRKKLKDSLKLPDDVTDEELLGLNAISETATYSTIQPINDMFDLESFIKNDQTTTSKENYFQVSLDDIDVTSNDLYLTVEAYSDIKEIYIRFKISNGQIQLLQDDIDENNAKFIKTLDLTEDFVVSITSVY
ncbi:uncharacterized protein SPAPADRAFT_71074 [Spathaspora passalidarum NRRL Y-27907]|uniref:Mediator of RNA polymerase II transcription subunit 1 n=1 Tax=Spathaspora passalidarum (strain NRRL Y-27907 / 11-Y1) TaxID=619300 RepID=G3ALE6_SPAPN|nr:uncharacterized protein SPAPADRAFT_71074 [Spathaspora passalidarum NRRL Y-27907]EGW33188.1 hypothetical protein SPAPADRAFT_71074 [Spathaspora passalidarum NRRL Y-27907]